MSFWHFRNEESDKIANKNILRNNKQTVSTDIFVKFSTFPLFFTFHVYFIVYFLFLVIYSFFISLLLYQYYQEATVECVLIK